MRFLGWLLSKIIELITGGALDRRVKTIAQEREAGIFEGEYSDRSRNFEADYNAAVKLLRERLEKKYPGSHYGRQRVGRNSPYDYGKERAQAVDTMSIAIAMALREGASVKEAAEAGATSIGI